MLVISVFYILQPGIGTSAAAGKFQSFCHVPMLFSCLKFDTGRSGYMTRMYPPILHVSKSREYLPTWLDYVVTFAESVRTDEVLGLVFILSVVYNPFHKLYLSNFDLSMRSVCYRIACNISIRYLN